MEEKIERLLGRLHLTVIKLESELQAARDKIKELEAKPASPKKKA